MKGCPFCDYQGPSEIIESYGDAYVIEPLRQVTPGHLLIVPYQHARDFAESQLIASMTMAAASRFVWEREIGDCNLITSKGTAATQTVLHLHLHLLPRFDGDGVTLPWVDPRDEQH